MGTAANAKLMKESTPSFFDFTAATDSGDHKIFTVTGKTIFSARDGYDLDVVPDGIVSGGTMLTTHASANTVTCPAVTVNLAGTETLVAAGTAVITRPATNVAKINSVTINASGAIAVVAGTDGATTTFSETRGAAGGPPFIPVGSVERGQVRMTSSTSAVISAAELFQEIGTHVERFDAPTWEVINLGRGDKATAVAQKNAHIEFADEIGGAIHTGDTYRKVYVRGYTPTFAEIGESVDLSPCEYSYSSSSKQVYGNKSIGSSSQSLGQGGFTAYVKDGVSDELVKDEGDTLVFKFWPDRLKTPYLLMQGKLGNKTSFPVDNINVAATISATEPAVRFSS